MIRRPSAVVLPMILAVAYGAIQIHACPRGPNGLTCTGKGACVLQSCECFDGYVGPSCSKRLCPRARAWQSIPYETDSAHPLEECSARGACDYEIGVCVCSTGFGGAACEKIICPGDVTSALGKEVDSRTMEETAYTWRPRRNACNGHGHCISARAYAENKFGVIYDDVRMWEVDRIFGCRCDEGYGGYDCGLRTCPFGDDPQTKEQKDEVQYMRCRLETGTRAADLPAIFVGFEGMWSKAIRWDDTVSQLEIKLNEISNIGRVVVRAMNVGCATVCCAGLDADARVVPDSNGDTAQILEIKFIERFGDLEPLRMRTGAISSDDVLDISVACVTQSPHFRCDRSSFAQYFHGSGAGSPTVVNAIMGTKESDECSGRGLCRPDTGYCECLRENGKYFSSDGRGAPGTRGDCGFEKESAVDCDYSNIGLACSGHGTCSYEGVANDEFVCRCNAGWTAFDCSERLCPLGKSWFGPPHIEDEGTSLFAHGLAECSNRGTCDRSTGECDCQESFDGAACDILPCPTGGEVIQPCSGHGTCLSLSALARETASSLLLQQQQRSSDAGTITYGHTPYDPHTWDHDKIYGCICDEGYVGFDCAERICPFGDNPLTVGASEIQRFSCRTLFSNGCFSLYALDLSEMACVVYDHHASLQDALHACDEMDSCVGVEIARLDTHDNLQTYGVCVGETSHFVEMPLGSEVSDIDDGNFYAKIACELRLAYGTNVATTTSLIRANSTANEVEAALRNVPHLLELDVRVRPRIPGATLCRCDPASSRCSGDDNADGDFEMEFVRGLGYIDLLRSVEQGHRYGLEVHVARLRNGTFENVECSDQGVCDVRAGECHCFPGFASSDGMGGFGSIPDCGFKTVLPAHAGGDLASFARTGHE